MRRFGFLLLALGCSYAWSADWLTDAGDPQRDGWQRQETVLNRNDVHSLQIIWKLQLDNKPREMHSFLPPLVVDGVSTPNGPKQLVIVAGSSDNIYAIDADTGKLQWERHFEYPPIHSSRRPGDTLCPGGQSATPVIGPADASGARKLYALDGNGALHQLDVGDGRELGAPVPFGWPDGKHYALNLWNNVIFTTTSQGCGGNPNQVWAIDVTDPEHHVMVFAAGGAGLWGRSGVAISSDGVAYSPTGDGVYDPEAKRYGSGIIGVKVEGKELKLKDYYVPTNWAWIARRDLDPNVTPAIFKYKERELMVSSSKECRIWLMDTKMIGGPDHQTPVYRSPLICNEEVNFAAAGVWGRMATWEDEKGTRWILTPFWGPLHSQYRVPVSHGPITHGAILALKLEEQDGQLKLTPAWVSRDMNLAEPPVIANGVIYTYGSGESETQATAQFGLNSSSTYRIPRSTHAVLYALDAETGEELYSSGEQIKSWNHFSGITVANGHVYIGTFDGIFYSFGLPAEAPRSNTAVKP